MAIYYSRLSLISRSRGHSAVAAAAYRAGIRLHDERTDLGYDYSKRKGVLSSKMCAPGGALWALDLASVWNRAEQAEVRRNARTGRELVVALPAELTEEQNHRLAHEIAQDLVDRYGVAVLVAVHRPDAHGDDRNVHCHLLMSTRVVGSDGFGAKVRVLDDRTTGPVEAEAMRARVAERINASLALAGHTAQVDPRRLRDQANDAADRGDFDAVIKLSRTPTLHRGKEASAMARRGLPSPVVVENAARRADNAAVSAWASRRAQTLGRAAHKRAVRCARRSTASSVAPAPRLRTLSKGLGPLNAITRATGADAEVLNEQAALAHSAARAARDASEKYLATLAREADRQAEELRAYFAQVRQWWPAAPLQATGWTADSLGARPLSSSVLERAVAAQAAYRRSQQRYASVRRQAARSELRTAKARAEVDRTETAKPDVLQPLSRRQWAEHRRRQRAQLARVERHERQARAKVGALEGHAAARHFEWAAAHGELLRELDAGHREKQRGTRHRSVSAEGVDSPALRKSVERVLSGSPTPPPAAGPERARYKLSPR